MPAAITFVQPGANKMEHREWKILPTHLLSDYLALTPALSPAFEALHDAELSTPDFHFYRAVASVYSSRIEGEDIELDSYIRHKRFGIAFSPDYTRKIDDLYAAYSFAAETPLNEAGLLNAHTLLSRHFLPAARRGKYRTEPIFVTTPDGRIEYVAALPAHVPAATTCFFDDLDYLMQRKLEVQEAFFFAALLHLVWVKIHPFSDGNGRSARLLEKWFLAHHLGEKAWFLQSEKHYYEQHATYYRQLRALGLEYEILDYSKALPFLQLLPGSLLQG